MSRRRKFIPNRLPSVRREWPSEGLIRWHFWLVLSGISMYVIALTLVGVWQGLALIDPMVPFQRSVEVTLPGLWARSFSGLLLTAGHLVFIWHYLNILRGPAPSRKIPPLHEARPVLYTGDGEGGSS